MKTTRERAQEVREAKLAHIREQVESGSLVIREMTAQERQRWGTSTLRAAQRRNDLRRHRGAVETRREMDAVIPTAPGKA